MPKLSPISWRMFIERMRLFGFEGPFQEGKHPYVARGTFTITVPNPHDGDIRQDLLIRILRQAGIPRSQWMNKKR